MQSQLCDGILIGLHRVTIRLREGFVDSKLNQEIDLLVEDNWEMEKLSSPSSPMRRIEHRREACRTIVSRGEFILRQIFFVCDE